MLLLTINKSCCLIRRASRCSRRRPIVFAHVFPFTGSAFLIWCRRRCGRCLLHGLTAVVNRRISIRGTPPLNGSVFVVVRVISVQRNSRIARKNVITTCGDLTSPGNIIFNSLNSWLKTNEMGLEASGGELAVLLLRRDVNNHRFPEWAKV